MTGQEGTLKGKIEAILYVSGEAVAIRELARALQTDEAEIRSELDSLRDEYDYGQRGFIIKRFGTSRKVKEVEQE